MTTTIEREVVQMSFDESKFEKGVRGALRALSDLKKGFDLRNAQKTFSELENASKLDFSSLAQGIGSINSKLSILGTVAATAISNLTTSLINGAKKLFDALVLAPIVTGLEEYETQLNAVQTILANTAKHGTTLQNVTDALDELNTYADQTIYNFTQMTDSIGKFTTAGVDLETSVSAIKGIANVAALSGSNAQQASTAMYQLSQAISSGTVRLQDWMSVENAGMGGQIFRDSLVETGKLHGATVDKIISGEESFRESLKRGWLTSEILLETLSKFTGDLTDAQLESLGYTGEQIAAIQKMAVMANDAATKIKTLTQLKDTLAEALQSGWGTTWRIIFGDFEQAKELWGRMGALFGDLIGASSDSRNSMLEFWAAAGGRSDVIAGIFNIITAVSNVLRAFGQGIRDIFKPINARDLRDLSRGFLDFSRRLVLASQHSEGLRVIVRGLAAIFSLALVVLKAILKPIKALILSLLPMGASFSDTVASISDAVVAFREFAIETGYFDTVVQNVITFVGNLVEKIKELVQRFLSLNTIKNVVTWFKELERSDLVRVWEGIRKILIAIATPFVAVALAAKELYLQVSKLAIIRKISEFFESINWVDIRDSMLGLGDGVKNLIDNIKNSELLGKFIGFIKTFDGRRFSAFLDGIKGSFKGVGEVLDGLRGKVGGFSINTEKLTKNLKNIGKSIAEGLGKVFDYLTEQAQNVDYGNLFKIINIGILGGLVLAIRNLAGGFNLKDILSELFGSSIGSIGDSISGAFSTMEGVLVSFQTNIKADALRKIAISIAILVGSIAVLTFLDQSKLLGAVAVITTLIVELFGAAGALRLVNTADALRASVALVGISIALGILSIAIRSIAGLSPDEVAAAMVAVVATITPLLVALKSFGGGSSFGLIKSIGLLLGLALAVDVLAIAVSKLGKMEPDELSRGLLGITAAITGLVASVTILTRVGDKAIVGAAISMIAMSAALLILGFSIESFGKMEPAVLSQGLNAVTLALTAMVGAVAVLTRVGDKAIVGAAIGMVVISGALLVLGLAVKSFGKMDPDELIQGVEAVGAILVIFAGFSRLLQPKGMIVAAVGLAVMSGALLIMVDVFKQFAVLSWDELLRGFVGLAGALLLIVISARLMTGAMGGALAMLVMSASILILASALKVLSQLSWEELLIALAAMAGALVLLGLAGLVLTPVVPTLLLLGLAMLAMGAGAALLGVGIAVVGVGLHALGAGIGVAGKAIIEIIPELGAAIALGIVNFLSIMADKAPEIREAMKVIIVGMIESARENLPVIVGLVLDTLLDILNQIAAKLPDIVAAGYEILISFLHGIEDNIAEVVSTSLFILAEFLRGLNEGLPDVVEMAFTVLVTFLNGIADGIDDHFDEILAAGRRIGKGIIDGIVKAIGEGLTSVWNAVSNLASSALNWLKEGFDQHSPSRKTYDIAEQVVLGFVNGIRDNLIDVRDVFEEIAEKAQNGIDPLISTISDGINANMNLNPIITPVLDLGQFSSGIGVMNRSFANSSMIARLSDDTQRNRSSRYNTTPDSGSYGNVVYNQYNYSPKALDRDTIYRQTRTQVARLERSLLG